MKRVFFIFTLCVAWTALSLGQQQITLEEIWQEYKFMPNYVPGFNFQNDGKHYTRLEGNTIKQYDLTTGAETAVILDATTLTDNSDFNGRLNGYSFSEDESKMLITSEMESIYRHSYRAKYFVYDRKSGQLSTVFKEGKIQLGSFSPDADKVAFVYQNNLYYKDLASDQVVQVTTDGETNKIINGLADWVYEEEFGKDQAFDWSPNGASLAFIRFDESQVPEFTLTNFHDDLYPEYVTFKYPKVGEKNATVTVHVFDLKSGKTTQMATTLSEDHYIPRIKWTTSSDQLGIIRLNRHQNEIEVLLANVANGKTSTLLKETNKYYISEDVLNNLTFLKDGQHFLWTSEKSGWHHIYLYDMKGKEVQAITQGQWDVTDLYGIDEKEGLVYYQAAQDSPTERQVQSASLKGKRMQKLAAEKGWNIAQFSSTFDYFVLNHSTANTPNAFAVYNKQGKLIRNIETNDGLKAIQQQYGVSDVEFFDFTTSEEVKLNGWMIKPKNYNPNGNYPVLMFVYGGPGSQEATDGWMGQNYWWFQMLAQQGFVVACVDNRGTGARGEEFKKMTYLQLGKYETIDQIEAGKYMAGLSYTDPNRIGIFGWSYGGYMSSLALFKGNDVFKAAIAVSPVTNWKWYDTIYTERFMRTSKENPDGYRNNSPVYFADQLEGNYLLVHGMGDDNVHFQNTAEMANALIAANKQYDTYFYPNRNHGIFGGPTRLHLYTKMTDFLMQKLKDTYKNSKVNYGKVKIVPTKPQKSKD
ncbi:MAG: peptidase S9 [Saprospiraceae bacterium]|nr:MAG: peptidase S9 [Saprospiraceae bacterium]